MKKAEIIAAFLEELIELINLIKESREDNHLRIAELIQLTKKISVVMKAAKQLQGIKFHELTPADIEHLVAFVMVNVKREVRFTQKDAIHALSAAVHIANIGK